MNSFTWVSNSVIVKGNPIIISEFKTFVMTKNPGDEGFRCFDFNEIIPMPGNLGIAVSNHLKKAAKAFKDGADVFKNLEPEERTIVRRAVLNQCAYGLKDWSDWCFEHWGTRWNAAQEEIEDESGDTLHYVFETVCSAPVPLCYALRDAFPDLSISWKCATGNGETFEI